MRRGGWFRQQGIVIPIPLQPSKIPEKHFTPSTTERQYSILVGGAGEEREACEHDVGIWDVEVKEAHPGLGGRWYEGGACVPCSVVCGGCAVQGGDGAPGTEAVDCP